MESPDCKFQGEDFIINNDSSWSKSLFGCVV